MKKLYHINLSFYLVTFIWHLCNDVTITGRAISAEPSGITQHN